MKVLVFAVVIGVLGSGSRALDCYHCVPAKAGGACEVTQVTCSPGKDACSAARFLRKPYGHFQKCMPFSDCEMVKLNAFINIKCCQKDFCNMFD